MTEKAGVGALFLAETLRHRGIGNVVDTMRTGLEHQTIHDAGHVAGNAAAGFGSGGVMSVRRDGAGKFAVTLQAHLVRVAGKFQGDRV